MPEARYRVEFQGRGGVVHAAWHDRELTLPIEMMEDGSFTVMIRGLGLTSAERADLADSLRLWFARSGRESWSIDQ